MVVQMRVIFVLSLPNSCCGSRVPLAAITPKLLKLWLHDVTIEECALFQNYFSVIAIAQDAGHTYS